jgi:hypothetical protein
MAGGLYGLARGFYSYTSDNGQLYQVAMTQDDATAGSFASTVYGTYPSLPRGWKMRKAYGVGSVSGNPVRTKIPLNSPTNSLWVAGTGTFSKGPSSTTFTAEGFIGEKRTAKS